MRRNREMLDVGFNSKLVRLKVERNGTLCNKQICFNSKLVRLKVASGA